MNFKKLRRSLGIVILCLFLVACSRKASPEMEKATKIAEETVTIVNDKKYDELEQSLSSEFLASISMTDFQKQLEAASEKLGTLEKIEKSQGKEKDGYYIVQVAAKQSEGSFTYTVSLDKDYKIAGFYVK